MLRKRRKGAPGRILLPAALLALGFAAVRMDAQRASALFLPPVPETAAESAAILPVTVQPETAAESPPWWWMTTANASCSRPAPNRS